MQHSPNARPPGPATRISVAILIVGIAIGVFGLIKAVAPFVRTLASAPSFATPGEATMHLSHGTYLVYERTGSSGLGLSNGGSTTLTPSAVSVTSSTGEQLEVDYHSSDSEHITRDGGVYVGALEFFVPSAGEYTVRVASTNATRVVIARSLVDTLHKSLPWWGVTLLGGGGAVAGTVMWIVGASRRRRALQMYAPVDVAPPPGWYPDPGQAGRLRYWDGATWTGHVS